MIKPTDENIMSVRTINGQDHPTSPEMIHGDKTNPRITVILSPFHKCMLVMGSVPPTSKDNPKLKIYNNLVLESVTLQAVMAVINTGSDIFHFDQTESIFRSLQNVVMVLTSHCSLRLMQTSYNSIMEMLQEHCYLIAPDDKILKFLKKCSRLFPFFGCLHAFVFITDEGYGILNDPIEITAERLPYGFRGLGIEYPEFALLVVTFQRFVYSIFVQSAITHYMFCYALICFCLSQIFKAFTEYTTQKLKTIKNDNSESIRGICNLYLQLCAKVKTINNIFDNVVFFWICNAVCNVCLVINSFFVSNNDRSFFLLNVPLSIVSFAGVLAISIGADSVTKHGSSLVPILSSFLSENMEYQHNIFNLCKMMIDKMMIDPPCLTAWGCITINKSLVMKILSMMVSYLILLVQMTNTQ
ncbi:uncharacterized protein LOC111631268 [Centruroides sculpturatus]|uniref:uncharacterized protein LOC111631268 n=1 Tax=Centruroides sculpturatus TaxID=218467 RepID=UPI000C6E2D3C|nr:uncharacterized protein LOC111631268 [Centruroides sculpturatus]